MAAVTRWLTAPVPLGRLAAFRTLIYLYIIADLLIFTPWVRGHGHLPPELYQPLLLGRVLPLPTPSAPYVYAVFAALLVLAAVGATGRLPRTAGVAVFLLYLQWLLIAYSYGKVDHDRFALLMALAVLPTVGRARHGEAARSAAAGWALRMVQIAVVATYFFASWAKLRWAGLDWLTGATLTWALIRRGSVFGEMLLALPWLLVAAQVGIVVFELLSPLVFVLRERWRYAAVGGFYSFHAVTFAAISISFMPHLFAMTSFLPLERVRPVQRARRAWRRVTDTDTPSGAGATAAGEGARGGTTRHPVPVAGDPPVDRPRDGADRPPAE